MDIEAGAAYVNVAAGVDIHAVGTRDVLSGLDVKVLDAEALGIEYVHAPGCLVAQLE